ncbi:hypothetical protein ACTXT7_010076 [Hymenolepis weldensis]
MAVLVSLQDTNVCSQTKASWSHIDLSLAGPILGISYLDLVYSYSKWSRVIPLKFATTGTIINSLCQVFSSHRYRVQKNHQLPSTQFEDFYRDLNVSLRLIPMAWTGNFWQCKRITSCVTRGADSERDS